MSLQRRASNIRRIHLVEPQKRHAAHAEPKTLARCFKHLAPDCRHCRRVLFLYLDSLDDDGGSAA